MPKIESKLKRNKPSKAQLEKHRQRLEQFAGPAAEAIGGATDCLFSVLPYEERFRQASGWYEAAAQAMLQGNYVLLDEWIRQQACLAAEQNFGLEDLLELLRICRRSAVEVDRWEEDTLCYVDEIINEGLIGIRERVPWNIGSNLNYLDASNAGKASNSGNVPNTERREFARNRVSLPIRIRLAGNQQQEEEITHTQNVSLSGLYFRTLRTYREGVLLRITYPYWSLPGGINQEYSARIARVDPLPDHETFGVAVEFLENLRVRSDLPAKIGMPDVTY